MGCEPLRFPSDAALDDWAPADAGTALRKWKKKLRAAFGVEEIAPGRQVVACQAFMPADPSQVPLPQTPVKQNKPSTGVFGSKGSPYMHDSHMVTPRSASRQDRVVKENEASRPTPNTSKGPTPRPDRRYDLNDDSSDDGKDIFDVDNLEGDLTEEWVRQISELSAREEKNSTPRIEITTHLPLGNIKAFSGYRNKSEKQLPRKTRRLSDAFIKYYCSKFNQSAKARYYAAKREDNEHVCDYLNRLNGYARNAGVQFENGGREAKDHVEHFLDTCDDRGLEECLCHVRVKDIHDLEAMINDILKRRDRKSKRDSSMRRSSGQDGGRRRDGGRNEDSRSNYRRDDRRRDESPYRPSQVGKRRSTKNTSRTRTRSVMESAEMTKNDALTGVQSTTTLARHVAAANGHERRAAAEGTFARSYNRRPKGDGHFNNDLGFTIDNRNGRQQYGPCAACGGLTHSVHYCYKRCKMCKQVHDAGKCEAFNELASLLRSKVDKNDLTPMLQSVVESFKLGSPPTETGLIPIGLPQLAEPAVDADCLFAFAGEVKWPEDREMGFVNTTEIVEGNDRTLGENAIGEVDDRECDGYLTEVSASCWEPNETSLRRLVQTAMLLPGERLGWWSSQRYDKRKKMRAVVMGAIDDARTRIQLDSGANVSVISAAYAKRLRLLEVSDHGRSLDFEMWIMEHSAGVDVVLGTDFMIFAGVRLDLFHGTARLPDEVIVPLVKSASAADDEPYGAQVVGGPPDDLYIPRG
ncbi:hypothetical protein PHMEG_00028434 [Phytophthora megakarya]|uniref:Peptidase A2 domain-containing protein n=1 Tax=Phytophthora megakarya TaxID=4795 RepID=A0A225V359_9STRA|nr:hypothetical protein PHMEG_00028434 [Phytophthora megakarya]